MKIAIIGDTHFGTRSGDPNFLEFQKAWFDRFFSYICAQGITTVVQSGDFFDVRQHMKLNVMHEMIHWFAPKVNQLNINWISYIGNHDCFYRDSNEVHSQALLKCLLQDYTLAEDDVITMIIGKQKCSFVPWMNNVNAEKLLKQVADAKPDYIFGHFAPEGFPMYKGFLSEKGLDPDVFKDAKKVFSGHYHTVTDEKNWLMLGAPYHLTWADVQDGTNRGFWVFDTETGDYELIKNEEYMTMFAIIEYDPDHKYTEKDFENYEGNIVKIHVYDKPVEKDYKKFCELASKAKFMDYKIIDTTAVKIDKVTISEDSLNTDTKTAIAEYIDKQEVTVDKENVKTLMSSVYMEALQSVK